MVLFWLIVVYFRVSLETRASHYDPVLITMVLFWLSWFYFDCHGFILIVMVLFWLSWFYFDWFFCFTGWVRRRGPHATIQFLQPWFYFDCHGFILTVMVLFWLSWFYFDCHGFILTVMVLFGLFVVYFRVSLEMKASRYDPVPTIPSQRSAATSATERDESVSHVLLHYLTDLFRCAYT